MYDGKFEHFITVAGAPRYIMEHFLKHFKKAYLEFNEKSIISDKKTYDALYYNKN